MWWNVISVWSMKYVVSLCIILTYQRCLIQMDCSCISHTTIITFCFKTNDTFCGKSITQSQFVLIHPIVCWLQYWQFMPDPTSNWFRNVISINIVYWYSIELAIMHWFWLYFDAIVIATKEQWKSISRRGPFRWPILNALLHRNRCSPVRPAKLG